LLKNEFFSKTYSDAPKTPPKSKYPEEAPKDKTKFSVQKLSEGTKGDYPNVGQKIKAHYTGTLLDGTKFDSSRDRGQPLPFELGAGYVIKCWDQGFLQLTRGQKAILYCPPDMAYGDRGSPPVIPPKATLIFDVELVDF